MTNITPYIAEKYYDTQIFTDGKCLYAMTILMPEGKVMRGIKIDPENGKETFGDEIL